MVRQPCLRETVRATGDMQSAETAHLRSTNRARTSLEQRRIRRAADHHSEKSNAELVGTGTSARPKTRRVSVVLGLTHRDFSALRTVPTFAVIHLTAVQDQRS